jgi:hypothetical protein
MVFQHWSACVSSVVLFTASHVLKQWCFALSLQVNCCVLQQLTPLEQFVFSERANHTVHKGSVKLTIYDQFTMLDTLRLHRFFIFFLCFSLFFHLLAFPTMLC